jgi:large subunit ribosomal protein L10
MAEMKVQQYKIDAVAELKSGFEEFRSFVFADYRGLSVEQITELRNALREAGAEFHVVKNKLCQDCV